MTRVVTRVVNRLWRCRWNLIRLALAGFLLWALAIDTPARLARLALAKLPDFDYAAEVDFLRQAGRFGEARVIADHARTVLTGPALDRLNDAAARTEAERSSILRRLTDAGRGALTGRGDSLESLLGAVTADLFIVGDVRDLVLQGTRWVVDGETDEVILVLSGVGLATTLAPEFDWAPAILKVARRSGALTKGLAESITTAARRGARAGGEALTALMKDTAALARRASPAGAARILRHADSPADVARLARFVERHDGAAFALHVLGDDAAAIAKGTSKAGDAALDLERAAIKAAAKGPAGAGVLRASGRALVRPHPLLGLVKAVYKGNAEALVARLASAIDPRAGWLLPLAAAWAFIELGLLARRLVRPA